MNTLPASITLRGVLALVIMFGTLASLPWTPAAHAASFSIADGDVLALVAAIHTANTNGQADTISLFPGGTYTLTSPADEHPTYGNTGLPSITSEITILGNGATIVRSSAASFRILRIDEGNLTLDEVTISNGHAGSEAGGGIFVIDGGLTLTDSTVTGNLAAFGSGIHNLVGSVTLTNTTISGNRASNQGGGINNNLNSTLTITNSTISGNTAFLGGGIMHWGAMTLTNSTISDNHATSVGGGILSNSGTTGTQQLTNTIVAGNTAPDGPDIAGAVSGSHNLIGDGTGMTGLINGTDGNMVGTAVDPINPMLGPLAHNGGLTETMALLESSPAIDSGTTTTVTTDQRGETRPQGDAYDIGAFEWVGDVTPPVITYSGNLGSYGLTDTIDITCDASDADSGIASHSCANITGTGADFGPGLHEFSAEATDNAGNVGTGSTSFTVGTTHADLCTLTGQLVRQPLLARSACAALAIAQLAERTGSAMLERLALISYELQIRIAVATRAISATDAQRLIDWSRTL